MLFFSHYCFRIHKDNPLAYKKSLQFEDFRGQKLIGKGRAYHCFRTNIDRYLFENGIDIDVPIETSDEELMMEPVEKNIAIAATYDFSAISHCGENTLIRYLDDPDMGDIISISWKKQTRFPQRPEERSNVSYWSEWQQTKPLTNVKTESEIHLFCKAIYKVNNLHVYVFK